MSSKSKEIKHENNQLLDRYRHIESEFSKYKERVKQKWDSKLKLQQDIEKEQNETEKKVRSIESSYIKQIKELEH